MTSNNFMSWTRILDRGGFLKGFPRLEVNSDTIFSPISENHLMNRIDTFLRNKKYFLSLDTELSYNKAVIHLISNFGKFINKFDNSILLRGNLEFIKKNVSHPEFGENLDLFTISNPFSAKQPIFLYSEVNKIKQAGIFGEARTRKIYINPKSNATEALLEEFFPEDIEAKIPSVIQNITDFDEVFTKKLELKSNLTLIKLGDSKAISSLQKLWMPSISGESIRGQVEGISSYSLVSFYDEGSKLKETVDDLINYFQPSINFGKFRFNMTDFDLRKKSQIRELIDKTQRDIHFGKYPKGFRASVGTVIKGVDNKRTKECIKTILKSNNIDYTNILDEFSVPRNLKSSLKREKLFSGNFRYYLLSLKILPVRYNISDIKNIDAKKLRIAISLAKLSPYLLDPKGDEIIVPTNLKGKHIRGTDMFLKGSKNIANDYINDHKLLD